MRFVAVAVHTTVSSDCKIRIAVLDAKRRGRPLKDR